MINNYTLSDACFITTGKLDSNAVVEGGIYPFYTCAAEPTTIDYYDYDDSVVLIAGNNAQGNFHVNRFTGKFNAYQRTYILTKKEGHDLDYIYYALKLELKRLKEKSQGSQTKFLTMPILNSINLGNRNLLEQQKISNVLSSLDSKIELNNKINKELEAMAKTLYDYWFVQFDFPDENEKPYKSSGGKMVYSKELKREIPEGWEVCRLENIEDNIITGKTPPKINPEYFDGDIPFITIGDIRGNMHITSTEETLSKLGADYQSSKYINKGALCVSCIASPGLIGFATKLSQTNQQINSIECKKEENSFYLYFALNNFFNASKAKTGNTFPNMNKGDFADIKLIKPNEQILLTFGKKIKSSIEQIYINSKQNQELSKLRDWLLPMLMNGQVKVK
ncbi:MAG: restriction endonuclease subunit S [Aliarcobacter sp.]|nr:restriction endonuclease subunit S [Aliarcobacter sp.]